MSKHSQLAVKFQCTICGMQYKTKWSLSTHISRYHRPASEKIVRKKSTANTISAGTKSGDNSMQDSNTANSQGSGQIQTEFVVVKNE